MREEIKGKRENLLGNGAIARGIIEAGCHVVYSYPGTPSSEILPEVVRYKKQLGLIIYIEWSTNEKVAFDNAFAASLTGKRSAVIMKQVGLNVASDSLMSAAYTGVKGGMVIVSCDDPGPHSSQTEQDSRFFAMFAKVPVFDPSSPQEAKDTVGVAFEFSEKYEIPVILRSTTRVCHAIQNVIIGPINTIERKADFKKDPSRWAATPKYRYKLHKELNHKLAAISADVSKRDDLNYTTFDGENFELGIISSGVCFSIIKDVLTDIELERKIPVLKLGVPYPFPSEKVAEFSRKCKKILVLEDSMKVIELQMEARKKILGRSSGYVPEEGELTPEAVYSSINLAAGRKADVTDGRLKASVESMNLPLHKPTLCPGCAHRSAFFAIKKTFPGGLFPSDIGCYTLGLNLGAVDTVLDMGASVTIASGFYHAYKQDGINQPVIATIGDSTFYHSGLSGLVNAVYNRARFILVILDNSITAMTGMQPTAGTGELADGSRGKSISLADSIKGIGIEYIKEVDPYDLSLFISELKKAGEYTMADDGGIAVIIAKHPCILYSKKKKKTPIKKRVSVTENCTGCRYCIKFFECPALIYNEKTGRADINRWICSDCGVCADENVCPAGAIKVIQELEAGI